jgi:transcriptional regulator with XRE-family HTH domain
MQRTALGQRLRELREKAGFSQPTLGEKLGRSQSYVSKAEAGVVGIDVEEIAAWAVACGRTFEDVVAPLRDVIVGAPEVPAADLRRLRRIVATLDALSDDTKEAMTRGFENAAADVRKASAR